MSLSGISKRVLAPVFLAAVAGTIGYNEGYKTTAYLDSAGVPTVCYGSTKDVTHPSKVSDAECKVRLANDLELHVQALGGLPNDLPDTVLLGSTDMAYNIGVHGFKNSSVYTALKNHDYTQASKNVLKWRYITVNGKRYDCSIKDNKVCYGLWKRRLWQSAAIGNTFKTLDEATGALYDQNK